MIARTAGVWAVVLAVGVAAAAEGPDAEPAAAEEALEKATVKLVEGTVDWREGGAGQPWQTLEVGQELAEGVDIRTGFRARCVLLIRRSLVQIDAMTVVRVGELRSAGDTVRTRLYLKQGRTQSIVEKGGTKSDFAIVTPSATLSVRGTKDVLCAHWPDMSQFGVGSGKVNVRDMIGRLVSLQNGQMTDQNMKAALEYLSEVRRIKIQEQTGLTTNEVVPQFVLPGGPTTLDLILNEKPPETPPKDDNGGPTGPTGPTPRPGGGFFLGGGNQGPSNDGGDDDRPGGGFFGDDGPRAGGGFFGGPE